MDRNNEGSGSFHQLSTTVTVERGENGHHGLQRMLEFLRESHMLGYKRHSYLEKVANLQLSSFEIEHSSSESALKLLSVAFGQESRLQAQYVDELKERVLKPLEVLFSHNATDLEYQKAQLREVVEKAKVHNEALIKAKKELDKASDEAKIATDKLLHLSELADEADKLNEEKRRQKEEEHSSSSSGFSVKGMLRAFEATPAENRDRQRRRVERRYQAVEQCNEDISAKKTTLLQTLQRRDAVVEAAVDTIQVLTLLPLYRIYYPLSQWILCLCSPFLMAVAVFMAVVVAMVCQALETRRLMQTKQSLADYVSLEKAVCERRLQQLESVTTLPALLLYMYPPCHC